MSVAHISESTNIRNAINALQVSFNPTFDLDAGSEITITGLTGTQTPSGRLPVGGVFVREYVHGRSVAVRLLCLWRTFLRVCV
jgi:hypothetical protein